MSNFLDRGLPAKIFLKSSKFLTDMIELGAGIYTTHGKGLLMQLQLLHATADFVLLYLVQQGRGLAIHRNRGSRILVTSKCVHICYVVR